MSPDFDPPSAALTPTSPTTQRVNLNFDQLANLELTRDERIRLHALTQDVKTTGVLSTKSVLIAATAYEHYIRTGATP